MITYYWPPSGGAGVHRWLRFSKYLAENNCNLTVYCPDDAAWPIRDEALMQEVPENITVIRRGIFEPHKYLGGSKSTGVGFTEEKSPSAFKKFIIWVRGNMFIPDSRAFWIKPSIRFLSKYLKDHPEIDTIISTGPPHSTHLIARGLKKQFKLKWIADFRDPWTQIDFYEQLATGKKADAKHKQLEKAVLNEADEVVTISDSCADGFKEIVDRDIKVITNGYEFPDFNENEVQLDEAFTIVHFGSMPFARNPLVLWKALGELKKEDHPIKSKLKIRLIGTVDYQVINSMNENGLEEFLEQVPPVSHNESIQMQRQSQLLLLVANNTGVVKGILTGKFFEYLGAKRPILAIGLKNSDLEAAMNSTNAGKFIGFEEVTAMKEVLINYFNEYTQGELKSQSTNLEQYHSATLATEFVKLF